MTTAHPKRPEDTTQIQAARALEVIQSVEAIRSADDVELKLPNDVAVQIPREAFDMFMRVLGQLANGNRVVLTPMHAMLTTQQAADMLSVSRPYFVGLLEEGKLAFTKVGRHRRVKYEDLMTYKAEEEARNRQALEELVALSQEMGV